MPFVSPSSPPSLWRVRAVAMGIVLSSSLVVATFLPAYAKVLAKVDGLEITDEDVTAAMEDIAPTLPEQLQGEQRQSYALDYLIDMKLVAKKAAADNLGVGPEIVRKLNYYKDKVLMESLLTQIAKTGKSETAMQAVYDEAAKNQKPEPEVKARHILVPTENEAKNVAKRLKAGEDFAKLAGEVSKDPGSPGGELGWFTRDKMVPEFSEVAFKMTKGQTSDPVKSQFGWHVIQVEDTRMKEFPPFEAVKDQIARYVVQKAQTDLILSLRKDAKIEKTEVPAAPTVIPGLPAK